MLIPWQSNINNLIPSSITIGFPQIHIPSVFTPALNPCSFLLIKLFAKVDLPDPKGPLMLNMINFVFFSPVKTFIASAVVSKIPSFIETNWIGSSLNSYEISFTVIKLFSDVLNDSKLQQTN